MISSPLVLRGTIPGVPDLDETEYQRWVTQAGDTLAFGGRSQADSPAWACFLAEQAAQFAVKGLLHGPGEGGWTNDLDALATTAEGLVPEVAAIRGEALRLSRRKGRQQRIGLASRYAAGLATRLPSLRAAVVFGSVALTPAEFALRRDNDPITTEVREAGVVVWGTIRELPGRIEPE